MNILNISTYPPQMCGLATFSMDLRNSLLPQGCQFEVIAVSDEVCAHDYPAEVVFTLRKNCAEDYVRAAEFANACQSAEIIVIQHEFGIFGGIDGEYILKFVHSLKKPFIIITHTVLPNPTTSQYQIMNDLYEHAAGIVCMTHKSAQMVREIYAAPSSRVAIISHGVTPFKRHPQEMLKNKYHLEENSLITTFGLLGPGKGLEIGIHAMADVVIDHPSALYLILGRTHPALKKSEGEKYRNMLMKLVAELHLEDNVLFVDKYLSDEELGDYLYMTDIYLSPYPNKDQAVSGTMAFALGCGCAIVSTSYLYAQEVLADGRGLLAKTNDPKELAMLINEILDNPKLKQSLKEKASIFGDKITWPNVGIEYAHLIEQILQHPCNFGRVG